MEQKILWKHLKHYARVNIHRIWEQLHKSRSKSGLVSFFNANFPLFLSDGLKSFFKEMLSKKMKKKRVKN